MATETFGFPDIKHPLSNLRLSDVVLIARNAAANRRQPPPASLDEVAAIIADLRHHMGHVWITGEHATDLLEAARQTAQS
jgi:hypothetical protein